MGRLYGEGYSGVWGDCSAAGLLKYGVLLLDCLFAPGTEDGRGNAGWGG